MKKIIAVLLILYLSFVAVACDHSFRVSQGSDILSLKLSAQMFDGACVDLNGAENIGLLAEEEEDSLYEGRTVNRTYIVRFREDGTFEKITFVFTKPDEYSDGTYEVTQEQIEPYPVNLCATDSFIFVSYSNSEIDLDALAVSNYNKHFDSSNENFAIDRKTGKLYSLDGVDDFSVVSDSVVKETGETSSKNYYYLYVKNNVLIMKDVMPNKNIRVSSVREDGFGNIYIDNESIARKEGNFVYITERVLIGDDGYAYEFSDSVYADPEDKTWGRNLYTVQRYGQDGVLQENWEPNETIVSFEGEGTLNVGYVAFLGDEIYAVNADGDGDEFCWYGTRTKGTPNTYLAKGFLPFTIFSYPLSPRILVSKGYSSDEIWYYDLLSEKIMGGVYVSSEFYVHTFSNQGLVLADASFYTEGKTVYARVEDVSGTSVYTFEQTTGENGLPSVRAVLCQEIEYNATVLIIQPLN